jgi:hypothetical protein
MVLSRIPISILSGQAGKPHPDRLVIGGAGDAQGALGIIVQAWRAK